MCTVTGAAQRLRQRIRSAVNLAVAFDGCARAEIIGALVHALVVALAPLDGDRREAVAELLLGLLRQDDLAQLVEDP